MKLVKYAVVAIVALPVLALLVLWIGAAISFDRSGSYSQAAAALPSFGESTAVGSQLVRIQANGYEFRARVAGFSADASAGHAGNVLLLHGFPETSIMWVPLIEALGAKGYRVVAFDQRGYSPGARPEGQSEYVMPQLVGDVMAVAKTVGFEQFHLVGHDWGSAVGWVTTMVAPQAVQTYNALSIPHVNAFGEAMAGEDSEQASKSAYMGFFAMPWLPERVFAFDDFDVMVDTLYSSHSDATKAEYLALFAEPGALTGALNWYRASILQGAASGDAAAAPDMNPEISLPVQFIWGTNDAAVSAQSVALQGKYLKGEYREVALEAGHWLMEDQPTVVVERIVDFIQSH